MARFLYTTLLWLALPLVLARTAWRARRQPGYLEHIGERFGLLAVPLTPPVIWVHCVSVGETRAAVPIIDRLRRDHPGATILLTHMTPTGRATGREIFGDTVVQAWLPWDLPFAARRFLRAARPALGILLETEIWPNLLAECAARAVPVVLVNARLSAHSAAGYARAGSLARESLGRLAGVAAQSPADAARLQALGAHDVSVTGNIKFDLAVPADIGARARALRELLGRGRRVWVWGSTRDGEESLLVDAVEAAGLPDDVLIVVVPRHPQRFAEVAALIAARGAVPHRRSQGGTVPDHARYFLGDSMGEMLTYYAASDVAFVGGSLKPYGGQNLIEPCAVGRPVIFGPHTFNFDAAAEAALAAGAALRARDATHAVSLATGMLDDAALLADMGRRADAFARANRGATERLSAWLAAQTAVNRLSASG